MTSNRNKLFISYSRLDTKWRDRFLMHLKASVTSSSIWADTKDIPGGSDWNQKIEDGIHAARCVLVLLTPNYIERGQYARETELPLILAARSDGLTVLPVLVEQCAWENISELTNVQLVSWSEATEREPTTRNSNDRRFAIEEVGGGDLHAQNRVIMQICTEVGRTMGIYSEVSGEACRELSVKAADSLKKGDQRLSIPSVDIDIDNMIGGQFSIVLFGRLNRNPVAVKILPEHLTGTYIQRFFDLALDAAPKLRLPPFIFTFFGQKDVEPHYIVMERVKDRKLNLELAESQGGRLAPHRVAGILAHLAQAQHVAHKINFPLGPLTPNDVYVDEEGCPKISQFHIQSQLARCATLDSGQHLSWDMLSWLTPESLKARILGPSEYDKAEQYYLGLLGLELLIGRHPVSIKCFADISEKEKFFADPRSCVEEWNDDERSWIETSPALAVVINRLLSRDMDTRYERTEIARDELEAVANDELPRSVRDKVDASFELVASEDFGRNFYSRLKMHSASLADRFSDIDEQHRKFVPELKYFIDFEPLAKHGVFHDRARQHLGFALTKEDVDAFRRAFVEEVVAVSGCLSTGDAWNALLKRGFKFFVQDGRLEGASAAR